MNKSNLFRAWSAGARGVALVAGAWMASTLGGVAHARDVYFSVGVNSPGVSVGVSNLPPVHYYPAPVVVAPPVVYAPPPPVVVYPPSRSVRAYPPVVYARPPVVYGPPPGHWHAHRGHWKNAPDRWHRDGRPSRGDGHRGGRHPHR